MNRLQAPADLAERVEEAFRRRPGMEGVPGFLSFDLLRRVPLPHGAPQGETGEGSRVEFVVMTRWASRQAFEEWTRSEHFRRSHAGTDPRLRELESQLEAYDVTGA